MPDIHSYTVTLELGTEKDIYINDIIVYEHELRNPLKHSYSFYQRMSKKLLSRLITIKERPIV